MAFTASIPISVMAEENEEQSAANDAVEVIEVRGIRSSLNAALHDKRNADSIQDSIAAEDLGKFPDQNVAESLQRITGVAISRENGEGSKITVRGFGPEFNLVQYNGRTLATTGRGRSFDFQLLPSQIITGASVVKAPTAKTPAGAIGGYVNVSSFSPLDEPGFKVAGSGNLKYNDLSENTDPQGSVVLSNTFLDDTLGLAIGLTHKQGSNRIDQVLTNRWAQVSASRIGGTLTDMQGNDLSGSDDAYWYPGRYRFGLIEEERERMGVAAVLEFAQGENITHTLDVLYSDFKRNEFRQGMQVPMQLNGGWMNVVVSDNGTAIRGTKVPYVLGNGNIRGHKYDGQFGNSGGESETEQIGYHFEAQFNKWTINFDASHSTAKEFEDEFNFVPHFVSTPDENGNETETSTWDLRGPGQIATFDSNIDIGDPGSARAHFNRLFRNTRSDEVTQFNLDLNYDAEMGILSSIDVGYSTSERNKVDDAFWSASGCGRGNLVEAPDTIAICNQRLDLDDRLFAINSGDYMPSESGSFPRDFAIVPDPAAYIAAIGELQNFPNWSDLLPRTTNNVATDENKDEAYVRFNLEGDANNFLWRGNIGVRHVSVENFSRGWGVDRLSITVVPEDEGGDGEQLDTRFSEEAVIQRSYDYTRTLPSANLQLDFENGFIVNLAASKVMAQPSIQDIGVNTNYNNSRADNFKRSGGNPFLDPYEATQTDISFEYYGENGSSYSIALFKKDIDTFIDRRTTFDDMPDIIVDGVRVDTSIVIPDFGNLIEEVTGPVNRAGGEINGAEFAALHYMDYLPEGWNGLGFQFNYTILDSKDDEAVPIGLDGVREPGSGLEGFSETSYNFIAFYEKYGWQARMAYNWRDDFLRSRDGTNLDEMPLYSNKYGQLDFSISYEFTENLSVSLAGVNVTDEKLFKYFDIPERLARVQYTGARYTLGIRAKF